MRLFRNRLSLIYMKTSEVYSQALGHRALLKIVLMILLIGLGIFAYSQWGSLIVLIVEWQKTLHEMLADHINAVSANAFQYGGALIGLSFLYGVFHAVGPGHGKAVIVTYLGTNKESLWNGVIIAFSAAVLQSVIAIALVSVLAQVLEFKLVDVQNYGNDIALVSYILVMMLGFLLLITSIRRLIKLNRSRSRIHHEVHDSHEHSHDHESDCGCSHVHAPEENQSIWQTLTVILSMGIRPCSGAIVVLIYAHLVGVYFYGVLATFLMGVGTGLSVSLIAIAAIYGRSWLEQFVSNSSGMSTHTHMSLTHYVRLAGGLVLMILGWSLYSAATTIASSHPLF